MFSPDKVAKEGVEGRMLLGCEPSSLGSPAKGFALVCADASKRKVANRAAKGAQDLGGSREVGTECTSRAHVGFDRRQESHARSPMSSSATRRNALRSTLA